MAVASLDGPIGVGEELAREQDRIGLAGSQDLLGNAGCVIPPDEQDGLRRDP